MPNILASRKVAISVNTPELSLRRVPLPKIPYFVPPRSTRLLTVLHSRKAFANPDSYEPLKTRLRLCDTRADP